MEFCNFHLNFINRAGTIKIANLFEFIYMPKQSMKQYHCCLFRKKLKQKILDFLNSLLRCHTSFTQGHVIIVSWKIVINHFACLVHIFSRISASEKLNKLLSRLFLESTFQVRRLLSKVSILSV